MTRFTPSRPRRCLQSFVAVTCAAVLALAGCGLSSGGDSDPDSQTLTVLTWKGYGADLDWAQAQFKKDTGASLRYVYVDSLESMVQKLRSDGDQIDVALPNVQYLPAAAEDGLLAPLDASRLDNFDQVYPEFSSREDLRVGDELYGVPWAWGSTALFYVDSEFDAAPTSYDVLWDPEMKGRIAIPDDPTVLIPITAMYLGEDPNNPDMSEVEPALARLKANAKMVYTSSDQLARAIDSGGVVAGIGASSQIGSLASSELPGLQYLIPTEGGVAWLDNWAISAASPNKDLAYEWLNYMTSSEYLSEWANDPEYQSPAPASSAAVDALTDEAVARIQPQPENISNLTLQVRLPADVQQSWIDAWTRVKAG
jgi:spermidine/putrescine-binding protein